MFNPNHNPQSGPFASPFPTAPVQVVTKSPVQSIKPRESGLPRFVNYLADYSGCGFWRILWPELLLNQTGVACSTSLTCMVLDPRWYRGVTAVKIQRQASDEQKKFVEFLVKVKEQAGFKLIYEVDDVVFREEIPDYNKFKPAFDKDSIRQNCIDIINMCDEVTVTCDYMRKLYQEKTGKKEVTVIPNFVPDSWMGHIYDRRKVYDMYDKHKSKPRVLYTGSGAHYDVDNKNNGVDDFSHVIDMVKRTVDKYQWVFVGSFPPGLTPLVQQKKIEFHPWQTLTSYPAFIDSLNAQVMIAPLFDNSFNRSKSDIKFIEACTLGVPCLVQDMETYKNAPQHLKFKTGEDLELKIDDIVKNKSQYYKNVDNYRRIAKSRFLEREENIGCHLEVLTTNFGDPKRKYLKKWN